MADFNATQAAVRCGYSPKTAHVQGSRLLKNVEVAAEIARLQAKTEESAIVTKQFVLEGLKKEALDAESDTARVQAYGLLGKHLALFTDKTELTGANGDPIVFNIHTRGGK